MSKGNGGGRGLNVEASGRERGRRGGGPNSVQLYIPGSPSCCYNAHLKIHRTYNQERGERCTLARSKAKKKKKVSILSQAVNTADAAANIMSSHFAGSHAWQQ